MGVLGGTFDPVHMGHLIIAEEAQAKLALDKVIFVPAGQPWLKEGTKISPARCRLAMLARALKSNENFHLDTQEINRPGLTYTVDTISRMKEELGEGTDLYFLIGLDALVELGQWKDPKRLSRLCTFVAMKRPGYTTLDLNSLERSIVGITKRICLVDNLQVDISSSDIRERIREGLSISYLLPEGVEEYIKQEGLYNA